MGMNDVSMWNVDKLLPLRSLSTMKVKPVVRGCSTYWKFGKLFSAANTSLFALVFSVGDDKTFSNFKTPCFTRMVYMQTR